VKIFTRSNESTTRSSSAHSHWNSIRLALALIIAPPVVGLLLAVLAASIPNDRIADQLVEAMGNDWLDVGNYPDGPITGLRVDRSGECVSLTIGLSGSASSALSTAIRNPTLGDCSETEQRLIAYAESGTLESASEYFRYWHGHAVVSRPLIALVGVDGTRVIAFGGFFLSLLGLARSLQRAHGTRTAVGLLLPLTLTAGIADQPLALQHSWSTITILCSSWIIHELIRRDNGYRRIAVASLLAGAVFVYVDILLNPPMSWVLTILVVTLAASCRHTGFALARRSLVAALAWIIGYTWMWFSKWILAAIVYGVSSVKSDISDQVTFRLDGESEYREQVTGFLGTTRYNFSASRYGWLSEPLAIPVLIVLVIAAAYFVFSQLMQREQSRPRRDWDRAILVAPILIIVIWYELLRNHSQIHYWFTYRSIAAGIGVIAVGLVTRLTNPLDRFEDDSRNKTPPVINQHQRPSGIESIDN
jgi:hypothetical protein